MRRRVLAAVLAAAAVVAAAPASGARHRGGKKCALIVHQPLGSDELIVVPLPVEDVPTDIGLVKVFVACHRH